LPTPAPVANMEKFWDMYSKWEFMPDKLENVTLLNFVPERNCDAAAKFWAHWQTAPSRGQEKQADPMLLYDYIAKCGPEGFDQDNWLPGEMLDWFYINYRNITKPDSYISDFLGNNGECIDEFCSYLGWEGEPDLAGIGVCLP